MIEVDLRVLAVGGQPGRTVATVRVEDDGSWALFGDRRALAVHLPMTEPGTGRAVWFHREPERWARQLLATPLKQDLVAVVVCDRSA